MDPGNLHKLTDLASGLVPDFVVQGRKEMRQTPYELSAERPAKFRKSSVNHLKWSNVILDSFDFINEKFKANSTAGRINPKVLLPPSNTRRYYATGEMPEFTIPPEFYAVQDTRKKFNNNLKLMLSQSETISYLKCIYQLLETQSFVSWHVGSVGAFLKQSVPLVREGSIDLAVSKLEEAFKLLESLDRAAVDSVNCSVPLLVNLLLKFRSCLISFLNPKISVSRKSSLLFSKLDFDSLLDSDLLRLAIEELSVANSAELARCAAFGTFRSSVPRSGSSRGLRGRGSSESRRPFRGSSFPSRPRRSRGGRGRGSSGPRS